MFVALDEAFDDDAAAFFVGHCEGGADLLFGHHVGKHTATVVAVGRFYHHGQTDILGRFPGVVGAFHDHAFRHGYTAGLEQALGQILVARDGFGNGAGLVGLGRPDTALLGTVAQLYQVVLGQAHGGDVAGHGRGNNAAGARAEQAILGQILEIFNGLRHIKGAVFHCGHDQVTGGIQRLLGDLVVQVVHDQLVQAAAIGLAGTAETTWHAGHAEQFQRDVLDDVHRPGAFVQAAHKAAVFLIAAAVLHEPG